MASCLQLLRDKRRKNGGLSNGNCQESDDDPHCLMEEFCCLYSEKLKAIDEEYPDSLELKCQALTELVSDLTEQNYLLLKAVEELEKEALSRVEAFGSLAEAAKDTVQQDTLRRGIEEKKSYELECKVQELQDALKQNESHLYTCTEEIDQLTKCLQEKNSEVGNLQACQDRMSELEKIIGSMESNLKEKSDLIKSLHEENDKLKSDASFGDLRFEEVNFELDKLKEELKQKNCVLEKIKNDTYNPTEEAKIDSMNNANKIFELANRIKWLEGKLEEKEDILKQTISERDALQYESNQANVCLASRNNKIEELTKEIERLKCLLSRKELEMKNSSNKECFMQSELKEAKFTLNSDQQRLKQYEEQIRCLENALLNKNTDCDNTQRIELLCQEMECLQEEIEKKNSAIINHKDQEENLKYEISRLKTFMNGIERQWAEKARYLECEIDKKEILLLKYKKQLENMNLFNDYGEKNNHKDDIASNGPNPVNIESTDNSDINRLKFKLKDVQEALTGEIADKHDEIRRLKDDVKELEEKLLHADKQTQFKDDIIKELRKEVKIGRAKESLAEMLGLKGTPRAAMKTRIDNLTGQLEEMRTHVLSLEERLAECNLPAVISLRSRLNNAEGSLLAMCNKMDYVRRYLENLKGDEELSIKCGLEALLSELSEDVEWNRQTRRNLSLDEGTSVIVISHRSHSLPDNSLHRLVSKTKSDSAVTVSKQGSIHSNYSLESFQECKNYIQVINNLELDFEETRKALNFLWNGFQSYTRDNRDSILNDLNDMLLSFENSKIPITEIIRQMEDGEDNKEDHNILCYHLDCLKENILEISDSLSKAHMISSSSENDILMEAGDAGVKKKLSTAINDSLSIIHNLEKLKTNSSQNSCKTQDKNDTQSIESNISSVIFMIKPLLEEKEKFFEKLAVIQKHQLEFSQTLFNNIMEFEKGFSTYNSSAESLRREMRKLFAIILTKEKQIQKQFDEIDNLKMALSSNKYVEEASEEIDSLRKVVSNKELQLVEKQELIQNLRSMNHSLRRRQLSQSSPSLTCTTENSENVMDKSHQLEDSILNIKEKFAYMSSDLLKSKDKMVHFEVATRGLVEVLTRVHKEITSTKESVSQKPEQLSLLHTSFTETECKAEELLQTLEIFICNDQPDFKEFSESINNHIEIILDIIEFLKRSYENERLLMKSLRDENEEMKQQLNKLQNRLTVTSSQQTELNENQELITEECETEEVGLYPKDDFIQGLQEDLCRCNAYLEKIEEKYTCLKLEKAEMEEKNQKVMEELQAKVCKLQAALQNEAPESAANTVYQLSCIVEQHSQKLCQFEIREEALKNEISSKDEELEINKSEVKSLKNKVNTINSMHTELKMKFQEAKAFIITLRGTQSEKELEIKSLKNKLKAVESLYSELEDKFEEAKEFIIGVQEKHSEKENEFKEMKFHIEYQQHEIKNLSEQLKMKSDQLNEMQISREISNVSIDIQLQELMELKEKVAYWENLMLHLKKEISDRAEEAVHWQTVSSKQKENLTNLIEENHILKTENAEFRIEKEKLLYDLETNKKELCELTGELVKSRHIIYQLNQEKDALENIKINLQSDLQEKEQLIVENTAGRDTVDKNILREQKELIGILALKIAQMNSFLSDRDETINLLESQLKTSTMLMLDNFDLEEDKRRHSVTLKDGNITKMAAATRTAAYKMKLWQSLEINRRLVTMVDSLQHLNYKLLQDQSYKKQFEEHLAVQHDEANEYIETVIPS